MTSNDGGPAFPQSNGLSSDPTGMTLRDYFAGQAITAISGRWGGTMSDIDGDSVAITARIAYELADAMLKARGR